MQHRKLIEQVAPLAEGGLVMQLVGQAAVEYSVRHGVTMVMVTEIKPGKEAAYRAWADRIQKLQATFPGYIGSFVQPPQHSETGWTTVLRFDSAEHLDGWLKSDARAAMVKESEDAGRKASTRSGSTPRFRAGSERSHHGQAAQYVEDGMPRAAHAVSGRHAGAQVPQSASRERSTRRSGTFIGNAITVALTTWPLMPLAIWGFRAWLFPENKPRWLVTMMPIVLVLCYALEIALLWNLLL